MFLLSLRHQPLAQHQLSRVKPILPETFHYNSVIDRIVWSQGCDQETTVCGFWKTWEFPECGFSKNTAEQSSKIYILRDEESPAGGEQGIPPVGKATERAPPLETPPADKALQGAPVPERHRSKECQEKRQYQSKPQETLAWKWK